MASGHPQPSALLGRRGECDALDRLVAGVRAGQSQVLVLRGEAGVGKTALLEYLLGRAAGCRIARAAGVESEMELPFAGLHQLCSPLLDRLPRLPAPQGDALRIAFGLSAGEPPDRFLVALAVLSLLAEVAEEKPLLCLIDDAQWLDLISGPTLSFVARRLLAERVGLVFAVREPSDRTELEGLPDLAVRGLIDGDARALLDSVVVGPVDERVRDRIVAETRGNPLALMELPRGLTPAELAGGFGLPDSLPLAGRIGRGFLRRLEALPADSRRLLLTAAADPVGDATLLWRALERLGIGEDAAAPAEAAGLIELGALVRFRHPIVRSTAYRSADVSRSAGGASRAGGGDRSGRGSRAAGVAPGARGDRAGRDRRGRAGSARRARPVPGRHRGGGGVPGPGGRADARPGPARDPSAGRRAGEVRFRRAGRGLRAVGHRGHRAAGGVRSRVRRRDCGHRSRSPAPGARTPSRCCARPPSVWSRSDAGLARETYLEALGASIFAGRLGRGQDLPDVAAAALAAPVGPGPPRAADLLLDGLATRFTQGYAAGLAPLRRAVDAFTDGEVPGDLRWFLMAWPLGLRDLGRRVLGTADHAGGDARPRGRRTHGPSRLPALPRGRRHLRGRVRRRVGPDRRRPMRSSRRPGTRAGGAPRSCWPPGEARRRRP